MRRRSVSAGNDVAEHDLSSFSFHSHGSILSHPSRLFTESTMIFLKPATKAAPCRLRRVAIARSPFAATGWRYVSLLLLAQRFICSASYILYFPTQFQDVNEECDEGPGMPTATCRNCTVPLCGDGVKVRLGPLCCLNVRFHDTYTSHSCLPLLSHIPGYWRRLRRRSQWY